MLTINIFKLGLKNGKNKIIRSSQTLENQNYERCLGESTAPDTAGKVILVSDWSVSR